MLGLSRLMIEGWDWGGYWVGAWCWGYVVGRKEWGYLVFWGGCFGCGVWFVYMA